MVIVTIKKSRTANSLPDLAIINTFGTARLCSLLKHGALGRIAIQMTLIYLEHHNAAYFLASSYTKRNNHPLILSPQAAPKKAAMVSLAAFAAAVLINAAPVQAADVKNVVCASNPTAKL
jgi:hypothetical protein